MQSNSTLTISWQKPDLENERWEFFHHPAKQDFYSRYRIKYEKLQDNFENGGLVPYPRSAELDGTIVELSYSSYEDYEFYLAKAKRGYRKSYNKMEISLQRNGSLLLPAPIIIKAGGGAVLFSGYRRLSLAWNYGMTPFVWLVNMGEPESECV